MAIHSNKRSRHVDGSVRTELADLQLPADLRHLGPPPRSLVDHFSDQVVREVIYRQSWNIQDS